MRIAAAVLLLAFSAACAAADPPATAGATPARPLELVNPGFEATLAADDSIAGWSRSSHAVADAYVFDIDRTVSHSGKASARIRRNGNEPWGMLQQALPAGPLTGHTLELSAWLRTAKVDGDGAILTLRALANGAIARHVFMTPVVRETSEWKRYSIRIDVPRSANSVEVGMMLQGDGTLWIDDVALVVLH